VVALFFDDQEVAEFCAMELIWFNNQAPKNYTKIELSNCPILESGFTAWNQNNISDLDILSF